jgi:hypothetical protein
MKADIGREGSIPDESVCSAQPLVALRLLDLIEWSLQMIRTPVVFVTSIIVRLLSQQVDLNNN